MVSIAKCHKYRGSQIFTVIADLREGLEIPSGVERAIRTVVVVRVL